jgi:hypothetical protein
VINHFLGRRARVRTSIFVTCVGAGKRLLVPLSSRCLYPCLSLRETFLMSSDPIWRPITIPVWMSEDVIVRKPRVRIEILRGMVCNLSSRRWLTKANKETLHRSCRKSSAAEAAIRSLSAKASSDHQRFSECFLTCARISISSSHQRDTLLDVTRYWIGSEQTRYANGLSVLCTTPKLDW